MTEAERIRGGPADQSVGPEGSRKEPTQVTLSVIGDVSVAASEAMGISEAPKAVTWRTSVLFFILAYALSVGVGWLVRSEAPLSTVAIVALGPVILATVVFWRCRLWRFRAKTWKRQLEIMEEALFSLRYEAANAANAIRANLIGFRLANPQVLMPEHLDVIQMETERIDLVVQKSQDPMSWKGRKRESRPAFDAQEARSRINL
ncbi:hypothetical protein HRbin08_01508 [bacterium HR08]|nr:hypothetical protein HRbin08_01508 [bacterium HR08]